MPGLRHVESLRVNASLTVPAMSRAYAGFVEMPPVFATAFMVGLIEWTCIEALRPFLDPREGTVGTYIDVSHVAPSPIGMLVTAQAELVEIRGRKLRFKVSCRDEAELVGEGFHERAIIDKARFLARASAKITSG